MERHHIIFRSHGGIDSDMNLISLPAAFHKGKNGPHNNRATDLALKLALQEQYFDLFTQKHYDVDDVIRMIAPHNKKSRDKLKKQIKNNFCTPKGYRREDIVRTLMGGKLYAV